MSVNTDSTTQQAITEILGRRSAAERDRSDGRFLRPWRDVAGFDPRLRARERNVQPLPRRQRAGRRSDDRSVGRYRRRGAAQDLILNRLEKTMDTIQTPKKLQFAFSPEELAQFHERGYAGPFKLYEPDEIEATWRGQRLAADGPQQRDLHARTRCRATPTSPTTTATSTTISWPSTSAGPRSSHRVASVLGPDVLCWRSEFFPKYPGDEGTDWHQADTFANASGRAADRLAARGPRAFGGTITVWTAFTEATSENGCMQFIPGTHRTMYYDETKGMQYDADRSTARQGRRPARLLRLRLPRAADRPGLDARRVARPSRSPCARASPSSSGRR